MPKSEEILKYLLENRKLSLDKAEEIVKKAEEEKKNIEDILVSKKVISIENLAKLKAGFYDLPYENLLESEIDEKTINIISEDVAQNYKIICFSQEGKKIKVGIVDPDNFKAMEAVDFLAKGSGFTVDFFII